jgi:hypothetical protein
MRPKKKKPFDLSPRQVQILQNWQSAFGVAPKIAAVIDDCGISTVNERLQRGEYDAYKDGARTLVTVESILRRRKTLKRAEYRPRDDSPFKRLISEISAAPDSDEATNIILDAAYAGQLRTLADDQLAALRDLVNEKS